MILSFYTVQMEISRVGSADPTSARTKVKSETQSRRQEPRPVSGEASIRQRIVLTHMPDTAAAVITTPLKQRALSSGRTQQERSSNSRNTQGKTVCNRPSEILLLMKAQFAKLSTMKVVGKLIFLDLLP